MSRALKLVSSTGLKTSHPRPIKTEYFSFVRTPRLRQARSCSVKSALVNAVKRLAQGDYTSAEVFDARGRLAVSVTPMPAGWSVTVHRKGVL